MKIFKLTLPKPLHDDLQTLSFNRGESMFGLALQALKEFIARARAGGELR